MCKDALSQDWTCVTNGKRMQTRALSDRQDSHKCECMKQRESTVDFILSHDFSSGSSNEIFVFVHLIQWKKPLHLFTLTTAFPSLRPFFPYSTTYAPLFCVLPLNQKLFTTPGPRSVIHYSADPGSVLLICSKLVQLRFTLWGETQISGP